MVKPIELESADRQALARAKSLLEQPTLAAKVANVIGAPFERSSRLLPQKARETLAEVTNRAVSQALKLSLRSLDAIPAPRHGRAWDKVAGAALGAAGGLFGLAGLAVELPASTVLILRSIAEIARAHGEELSDAEAQLACVQVFALGGFSSADDAAEAGYFATRAALAGAVTEAARYVAREGLGEGAPALIRLVTAVAARFGVVVTDKVILTALPIVGAVSGATVNTVFVDHFQRVAEGHFTVRELERKYGAATVQDAYSGLDAVS